MRLSASAKKASFKEDNAEIKTACVSPDLSMITPVKRRATSGVRHAKSASVQFFDPMQYINSSDEEECTFHPKINANAHRLSQRKISAFDASELLYKDASDRKNKVREFKEIEKSNYEKLATKTKIGTKSVKIIWKKLQSALSNLITNAEDLETQGQISFQGLGTVLYQIGLFQNLEFIPSDNKGEKSSVSINQAKVKPERLAKEIAFHEALWRICSLASNEGNGISSELVLKTLIVFLEDKTSVAESAALLLEIVDVALESNGVVSEDNQPVYLRLREERNLWSLDKLVGEFRRLFDDKTSFMNIYSSSNMIQAKNTIENDKQYNFSFKPQTSKKTAVLDNKYLNERLMKSMSLFQPNFNHNSMRPRYNRLYNYSGYLKDKKSVKLEERIREELSPCTFAPKTTPYKKSQNQESRLNNTRSFVNQSSMSPSKRRYFDNAEESGAKRHLAMYEVAKDYKEKLSLKAYTIKKKEEAEEMAECTFAPKLNRKYETSPVRGQDFYEGIPKGFKKIVGRLQTGDYWRQTKQAEIERIPRGENYEKNREADFNPPTFLERPKIKREEVLVYVDVNIGPGKTGKIGIHRGDKAKELAKNFSKTYSLNANTRESLEQLLQSYIDKYFAKIPPSEQEIGTGEREDNKESEENDEEEDEEEEEEEEDDEEDN